MSDAEQRVLEREALGDPEAASRAAWAAMRAGDVPRAIDVLRIGGNALVVLKVPEGTIQIGGEQVSCVSLARRLVKPVESLPGVAVLVVPLSWGVEVHALPEKR